MTISANTSGVVAGKFTIPDGIPSGTKTVAFTGAGGSHGTATFTGSGSTLDLVQRRIITNETQRYDPLAQTFSIQETCQISAADLWFSAKGDSTVVVQVKRTENGIPTNEIIAETRIDPVAITTTGHTRITFASPVNLLSDVMYALVVACNDATTALRTAELGKWDATNSRWVTSQPYQVGVLLSSSNASTWTAHQDRDLAFRLQKAVFSETNKSVALGTIAVTGATDLMLLADEEAPSTVTRISYSLSLPGGEVLTVSSGQPVRLAAAITGNVVVSAQLNGDATASPVLFPGTQLLVSHVGTTGTYVSRAIPGGTSVRVKVVFDAELPAGSSVLVEYKGVDGGDVWATVPYLSSVTNINGSLEMTHQVTGVTETMVQIRLTLTGTAAARPVVKNLRFMII